MKILISKLLEQQRDDWNIPHRENPQAPQLDAKRIMAKINEKAKGLPSERKWKRRPVKLCLAATILICLGSITAFAAVNSDWLDRFFRGDIGSLEAQVKEIGEFVSNDDYRLTLDQVLVDPYNFMIVGSLEALSENGEKHMNDPEDRYGWLDAVQLSPVADSTKLASYVKGPLEKRSNGTAENKRYFIIRGDAMGNPQEAELRLYLLGKEGQGQQSISVPMDISVETAKVGIDGQGVQDGVAYRVDYLDFSSIGMRTVVERASSPAEGVEVPRPEMIFRMKDGSLWSQSQLMRRYGGDSVEPVPQGGGAVRIVENHLFREPVDLKEFQAVIVNGREYSMNGTGESKAVSVDQSYHHFAISPVVVNGAYGGIPVEELCRKLGAELDWNKKSGEVNIRYREIELKCTLGSEAVIRNGAEIGPISLWVWNGELVSDLRLAEEGLDLEVGRMNYTLPSSQWSFVVEP